MTEQDGAEAKPRVLYPPSGRERRRKLPTLIKYALAAFLGALLAVGSFYLVRELGY